MKAYFSLFKIAISNKKIIIKNSKISNDLNKDDTNYILDYAKTLINSDGFIQINGKLEKLTFFVLNDTKYLLSVIPSGITMENEDLYTLKVMHFKDNTFNPFNAFLNDYFIKENDNKDLIINSQIDSILTQNDLNKIDSSKEKIIATFIELLLIHDKPIVIYSDNFEFYFSLVGLLLPNNYLFDISYTYGGIFKNMQSFNLIGINKERMITANNIYYFDFNNNAFPNIKLGRYSLMISSLLLNSIDDVIAYKDTIYELINHHNIDANRAAMLNNLIAGKIEAFTNTEELKEAIIDSNYEYNNTLIASAIYTSLNKFRIDNSMLVAYKYVFDYIDSSHDEIIKLFFSNLNKFGISINLEPDDYLNLIEKNAPFDLSYYYDYLIKYNLFNAKYINGIDYFNEWYILLDAICKDIKKHNKQIVPNEYLTYYISLCVKNKKIDYLDLVTKRISKLNKKASSRLLYFVLEKIDREYINYTDTFGIYYTFRIIERMAPSDAIRFYIKSYNSIKNRKEYIDLYLDRENKKPEYYKEINELFIKNGYDIFIDLKSKAYLNKETNITLDYLDDLYQNYYLNKNKKESLLFFEKIFDYLNKKENNDRLKEASLIYNRYFKSLDDNYIDKDTFIRRLSNYIYLYPDLVFENDLEYYDMLFEIDLFLQKKKEKSPIYLDVLKSGLDAKKSYINSEFRDKYFKSLLIHDNKWFNADGNEYYNRYYLKYLLSSFYKTIPSFDKMDNHLLITVGFKSLFNGLKDSKGFKYSFINTIVNYPKDEFKLNFLYFLIFEIDENDNVFKDIKEKIISETDKVNKLFKEYYKVLKNFDFSKEINPKLMEYIDNYLINNLGFIRRIIWKIFKR